MITICHPVDDLELLLLRASYAPAGTHLATRSGLRMLVEALWFGWVIPGGKRRSVTGDGTKGDADEPGRYHGD